jgi:hypothetical protein
MHDAELHSSVRDGFASYQQSLRAFGLPETPSSVLHGIDDVHAQALIQAAAARDGTEQRLKAQMTYASHFIDDAFDRADMPEHRLLFRQQHLDIKSFADRAGALGDYCHHFCQLVPHQSAAYKGLERIALSVLINDPANAGDKASLLQSYLAKSVEGLTGEFAAAIAALHPEVYALTAKTVQEIALSSEPQFNVNLAEGWSLLFAPALLRHDEQQEREQGELTLDEALCTTNGLLPLIETGRRFILQHETRRKLRCRTLALFFESFAFLEPELLDAYRTLLGELVCH